MVRIAHQLAETLGGGGLGRLNSGIGFNEKNNVFQEITGIKFAMLFKRITAIQSAESIPAPDWWFSAQDELGCPRRIKEIATRGAASILGQYVETWL